MMIVRMFEYDTQIALDAGEIVQGTLTVEFPHSAILYLSHNSRTPDAMTVKIKTLISSLMRAGLMCMKTMQTNGNCWEGSDIYYGQKSFGI